VVRAGGPGPRQATRAARERGPRLGAHAAARARGPGLGADLTGRWRFAWGDVSLAVDNVGDAPTLAGATNYASWFDRTTARSALPVVHYTAAPPRTARLVLTGYL